MNYRPLGKTGLMVSEIGFGGEWITPDMAPTRQRPFSTTQAPTASTSSTAG